MNQKQEAEKAYAEIMHLFRYFYKNSWAPDNIFDNKSRVWIQCFNNLVKKLLKLVIIIHEFHKIKGVFTLPSKN